MKSKRRYSQKVKKKGVKRPQKRRISRAKPVKRLHSLQKKVQKRGAKRIRQQKSKRRPQNQEQERAYTSRQTTTLQRTAQQPNLLVTYDPNREASARQEIQEVLQKVNQSPVHMESVMSGVMKVQVPDAKAAVRNLREYCAQKPEKFSRTFHWTPIDRWCPTEIAGMKKIIDELGKQIRETEKWKIKIDKRECDMHERELIVQLTANINKPNVDLQNPEKILKIDILGKETGVALLKSEEYLSVPKMKETTL